MIYSISGTLWGISEGRAPCEALASGSIESGVKAGEPADAGGGVTAVLDGAGVADGVAKPGIAGRGAARRGSAGAALWGGLAGGVLIIGVGSPTHSMLGCAMKPPKKGCPDSVGMLAGPPAKERGASAVLDVATGAGVADACGAAERGVTTGSAVAALGDAAAEGVLTMGVGSPTQSVWFSDARARAFSMLGRALTGAGAGAATGDGDCDGACGASSNNEVR